MLKTICICGIVFGLSVLCSGQDSAIRTWHIAGKATEAKYMRAHRGELQFKDAAGKIIKTTLDDLAYDDQLILLAYTGWGRLWVDATSTGAVAAEIVGLVDDEVLLERPDEARLTVKLDQLSAADREYAESQRKRLNMTEVQARIARNNEGKPEWRERQWAKFENPRKNIQQRPLSRALYDTIEMGISYQELESILGREGTEMQRSQFAGLGETSPAIETIIYVWSDEVHLIIAMFQNGKLVFKAENNLK